MKCCVAVSMHVLLISVSVCHLCGLVIKLFRYIFLFLLQQKVETAIFTQVAKLMTSFHFLDPPNLIIY